MQSDWPDLVIGGIALLFAWKGFRNGFVAELAGPVALLIAIAAAFFYPGSLDADVVNVTHLGPGSSHAIGTVVFAAIVYAIVTMIAWLLGRVAKLPGVAIVNGGAGALVGGAKALLGAWAVLYVALFFPLTPDLRDDLHTSQLVAMITAPDAGIDATAREFLPWFVKPFLAPIFARHHT
jgi:membrane protein required for colicin V production